MSPGNQTKGFKTWWHDRRHRHNRQRSSAASTSTSTQQQQQPSPSSSEYTYVEIPGYYYDPQRKRLFLLDNAPPEFLAKLEAEKLNREAHEVVQKFQQQQIGDDNDDKQDNDDRKKRKRNQHGDGLLSQLYRQELLGGRSSSPLPSLHLNHTITSLVARRMLLNDISSPLSYSPFSCKCKAKSVPSSSSSSSASTSNRPYGYGGSCKMLDVFVQHPQMHSSIANEPSKLLMCNITTSNEINIGFYEPIMTTRFMKNDPDHVVYNFYWHNLGTRVGQKNLLHHAEGPILFTCQQPSFVFWSDNDDDNDRTQTQQQQQQSTKGTALFTLGMHTYVTDEDDDVSKLTSLSYYYMSSYPSQQRSLPSSQHPLERIECISVKSNNRRHHGNHGNHVIHHSVNAIDCRYHYNGTGYVLDQTLSDSNNKKKWLKQMENCSAPAQSITAYNNGMVEMSNYNPDDGRPIRLVRTPLKYVKLLYDHGDVGDTNQFIVTGNDNIMALYDIRMMRNIDNSKDLFSIRPVVQYEGHRNNYHRIPFSVDLRSNLLVSSGTDRVIRFWNISTGELVHMICDEQQQSQSQQLSNIMYAYFVPQFCVQQRQKLISNMLFCFSQNQLIRAYAPTINYY